MAIQLHHGEHGLFETHARYVIFQRIEVEEPIRHPVADCSTSGIASFEFAPHVRQCDNGPQISDCELTQ